MPKPFDTVEDRQAFFELTGLSIEEGSFVDKGDNPEAHIVLTKAYRELSDEQRAKLAPATRKYLESEPAKKTWLERAKAYFTKSSHYGEPKTTAQILAEDEFRSKFMNLRFAFTDSVHSILNMPTAQDDEINAMSVMMNQTVQEFADKASELTGELTKRDASAAGELAGILDELARSVSKGGDANRGPFAQAMKDLEVFEFPAMTAPTTEDNVPAEKKTPTLDELVAKHGSEDDQKTLSAAIEAHAKAAAEKAVAEALKAKTMHMDEEEKEKEDEKKKAMADALPAELRKSFDAMTALMAKQGEQIEKLQEQQTEALYLEKAKDIAKDAGLDLNETANSLRKAYEVSDAIGASIEKQLRALAEQVKLTKQIGAPGAFPVEKNTGEEKLEQLAKEIQKAEGGTYEEAYAKAMDRDPDAAREAVPPIGNYN